MLPTMERLSQMQSRIQRSKPLPLASHACSVVRTSSVCPSRRRCCLSLSLSLLVCFCVFMPRWFNQIWHTQQLILIAIDHRDQYFMIDRCCRCCWVAFACHSVQDANERAQPQLAKYSKCLEFNNLRIHRCRDEQKAFLDLLIKRRPTAE
jgi:hypothetical protein